jgi:glycosyltransferase involved in cell wall biosynthesis
LKVALRMMGDEKWVAGEILTRTLLNVVGQLRLNEFKLSILASNAQAREFEQSLGADDWLHYQSPNRRSLRGMHNGIYKRLFGRDKYLEQFLMRHEVNVLFSPFLLFKCSNIATLSWLPDFQHVHLPEMFSDEERLDLDQSFMQSAELATRIILLSNSVKEDFQAFAPRYATKGRVLSPVSRIPDAAYEMDPRRIVSLYHLPEKFVYLPNQFWKHKNHELVFRAVKNLKHRGVAIVVVCSGYPADFRHAGYFAQLWESVSKWGLRDQVIYLGMVPHEHVHLLIRQSVCVINPSRFEGWGMSVDEARSVGKQVLISDISTHREQDPPKATYFNPENCEDLEEKLAQIWNQSVPGPDAELEREARLRLPARLRSYAETFVSVSREAFQEAQR